MVPAVSPRNGQKEPSNRSRSVTARSSRPSKSVIRKRGNPVVLLAQGHPDQGFRTCLGILRLYRGITADRAEAVSARAIEIGALNYQSIASILEHRLETRTTQRAADSAPILHANIRGSRYYH